MHASLPESLGLAEKNEEVTRPQTGFEYKKHYGYLNIAAI